MKRGLYGSSTVVLSSIVALIGIAIVVRTIAGGGGPIAQGLLIGALFFAAGAGRAWMAWRGATLLQPPGDALAPGRSGGDAGAAGHGGDAATVRRPRDAGEDGSDG